MSGFGCTPILMMITLIRSSCSSSTSMMVLVIHQVNLKCIINIIICKGWTWQKKGSLKIFKMRAIFLFFPPSTEVGLLSKDLGEMKRGLKKKGNFFSAVSPMCRWLEKSRLYDTTLWAKEQAPGCMNSHRG